MKNIKKILTRFKFANGLFFILLILLFNANSVHAQIKNPPLCRIKPTHLKLLLPHHGFVSLDQPQESCEDFPAEGWMSKPFGSSSLFVRAEGPSGSGRYWNFTVGLGESRDLQPRRGICFSTSTVGWRTLQHYPELPLPWLKDFDHDGKAELILWESFPFSENSSLAEYGLIAWVYRFDSKSTFLLDWSLTRKMAKQIARFYRLPPAKDTKMDPTRNEFARLLERFGKGECSYVHRQKSL